MLLPIAALAIARVFARRHRPLPSGGCEILLTGRFDSENWILSHLSPLAASTQCSRVWMVSTNAVPALPKVTPLYPPRWLVKVVGATIARFLVFSWAAIRKRPHIVGGFHIMPNGIAAIIVGRLAGARSMYFCVGGPAEVRDGGIHSADSLFKKMETADAVVESRLLKIVAKSDIVITMGSGAVRFFRGKGIDTDFHVVPGGIDSMRFQRSEETPSYDLILTGRLVDVKRIDVFLRAIREVAAKVPDVKAVIVGDGSLREELYRLSVKLGVGRNVNFIGHQDDVDRWLRRSKVFVLTSDSEGLSLSMMEAMMCGLPVVVSDVGDLGDLVENGVNGYLVPRRSPELFAERLVELLLDERKRRAVSVAAQRSALRYETRATIQCWDRILSGRR
jgi:glycosyltransferase involved in cell wall biosynthesis